MTDRKAWGQWINTDEAYRRAGGRRHYNAVRQFRASFRRLTVASRLLAGLSQAAIARELGVHRSTINRDIAAMAKMARRSGFCPCCGSLLSDVGLRRAELWGNEDG